MARENKKGTKAALLIFKAAVSSALLIYLFSKVGGMAVIKNAILLSPVHFVAAVALYLFATYLSSLRWKLLIPQQTVRTGQLFSMYIIGSFFNVCLPGIIGGDAVKAYYLSRQLKQGTSSAADAQTRTIGTGATAVASVFMDRYIGLAALLFIGLAAFPAGFELLRKTSSVVWAIPILCVAFFVVSVLLFRFPLGERFKFLVGVYDCFNYYLTKRNILLKSFLLSIVIQIAGMISVYVLARGMSIDVSIISLLVFLPMIILISMIPVSISGLGIREGAFVFFLGTTGIPPDRAMTLSILWFLSVVVAGLWGLVEYLRFKQLFGSGVK
ncbi:MAG: lysylphosphatidylglycerol synthase transmembrane domain-containing protein [Dissulfurispiraceae bacterium]